jgi:hypothetical protein
MNAIVMMSMVIEAGLIKLPGSFEEPYTPLGSSGANYAKII